MNIPRWGTRWNSPGMVSWAKALSEGSGTRGSTVTCALPWELLGLPRPVLLSSACCCKMAEKSGKPFASWKGWDTFGQGAPAGHGH